MSAQYPQPSGPVGGMHPAVFGTRVRELLMVSAAVVVPLVISLAVAAEYSRPNITLTVGLAAAALAVIVLACNSRLEVTVTILALYLGLLDGPVKLLSEGHELATAFRDVLIFAVSLGALARLVMKRERIRLPPLSGWVILFVVLVLAEAFNPHTHGILKALGGFRQQLEFVPFFFFGYVLMRSKERFRKFFLILGVVALANGLVSTYQTKLGLAQLASWGPGYRSLVYGTATQGSKGGISARAYGGGKQGPAKVRPPALGKDSGFGGSIGLIAVPCTLALVATWRRRKRWAIVLLCIGAALAVVTGLGRLQVVGAVLAVLAFVGLSAMAGRRAARPLMALVGVLAVAIPAAAVLVSVEAPGTFSRYSEIAPGNISSAKDTKSNEIARLPHQLSVAPFGVGLATAGAASGFGGLQTEAFEGHRVGAETQYNFMADELGIPGLVLWVGLSLTLIALAMGRLRRIRDTELRIDLAAIFAVPVALLIIGVSGPVMSSSAAGPFFWFAVGIAAYWFAGPGTKELAGPPLTQASSSRTDPVPVG